MPIPRSLYDSLKKIIPPLDGSLHKGQSGRVGVIGGAQEYVPTFSYLSHSERARCSYTGAPFFAAITALRVGADLSHVICAPSAANAIKSYAPDLIVHPILHPPWPESPSPDQVKSELSSLLSRLHVLVIGPGLGRESYMISHAKTALELAKENGMYVVLDADALWMLGQDLGILKGYRRAVVTPNVVEFRRLSEAVVRPFHLSFRLNLIVISRPRNRALTHQLHRTLEHPWFQRLSEASLSSKKARKTLSLPTPKESPSKKLTKSRKSLMMYLKSS